MNTSIQMTKIFLLVVAMTATIGGCQAKALGRGHPSASAALDGDLLGRLISDTEKLLEEDPTGDLVQAPSVTMTFHPEKSETENSDKSVDAQEDGSTPEQTMLDNCKKLSRRGFCMAALRYVKTYLKGADWCDDKWIGEKDGGLPGFDERNEIRRAYSECFRKCDDAEKKLLQDKMKEYKILGSTKLLKNGKKYGKTFNDQVHRSFSNAANFGATNQEYIRKARRALRRIRRILDVCIDDEGKDKCGIENAIENKRKEEEAEKRAKEEKDRKLREEANSEETEGTPAVVYKCPASSSDYKGEELEKANKYCEAQFNRNLVSATSNANSGVHENAKKNGIGHGSSNGENGVFDRE